MKICTDCHWHKATYEPMGKNVVKDFVCTHVDCRDPVNGMPLPCSFARKDPNFCGLLAAKYFKEKEEVKAAPIIEVSK